MKALILFFVFLNFQIFGQIEGNGAGYTLDFGGGNDYVSVPDANSLDISNQITIEAWFKPDILQSSALIRKAEQGVTDGYELSLSNQGGGVPFVRFNQAGSGDTYKLSATITYQNGVWSHVAATYDGSTIRIYFNGVEAGNLAATFTIGVNALNLTFGADGSGLSKFFNGQLDEVRIWSTARTVTQIRNNMCKKLTGSETGLEGYWRFDETTGTTISDETANNNDGTMIDMDAATDHVWSGAAIGDVSAADYDIGGGGYTLTLSHGDGDEITATAMTGTISGIQVYRVNDNSVRTGSTVPSGYTVDPLRYWGVRIFGTSSPTFDVVYNYGSHPGYTTDADLRLVTRSNVSDPDWLDAGAILNEGSTTLTLTGETGTEYALASISEALPVELTSFTAIAIGNSVSLNWRTETEVNNYGFEIQRAENLGQNNFSDWQSVGFVEGHGNTNSPKNYTYNDGNLASTSNIAYRLKQIDNDGQYEYSSVVEVSLVPVEFALYQNFPNPFNPTTRVRYSIAQESFVSVKIFDITGNEVRTLVSEKQIAGNYEIDFDANNLASGTYFYRLQTENFVQMKKMLLLK